MKCLKCGSENHAEAKLCGECGSGLESRCPGCGNGYPVHFKFCSECGHKLQTSAESASIDYSQPQSYTPKFLAEKILTQRSSIEGERKVLTVMFTDVANFTPLSERVGPEVVHQIMDGCFRILLEETHRYEGTINQFTGDGVMALFGAPVAHEDHAVRACHAALAIQKALKPFGEDLKRRYGVDFRMRVGLNSGPVIVGAIGDDLRMDYTAVGDTTNLAARMEQMAEPGKILLTASTCRLARDFFEFQELGKKKVKGKQEEQEIFELIRVGDFSSRLDAAAARGLTPFIGREQAVGELMRGFEKVRSGAGQVLGIVGEAGVGKSRLLLEFRGRLPMGEYCYLEGRCIRFGHAMAYLPIREIVRSYFGIVEGEPDGTRTEKIAGGLSSLDEELRPSLIPLQELLGIKVEDPSWLALEPREKRERIFRSAGDLLQGESRSRPLVIAVEDLHWIDKSSEEFLDYFMGYLKGVRILLLLLYRPEYHHDWGKNPFFRRVSTDQLPSESGAALVSALLKGGEVVPELADLIYSRSGGNPLFMEELTRTLLESGAVRRVDHRYTLADRSFAKQVPETVQGIIAARMDRLSDSLKVTLQAASVIGREFEVDLLGCVNRRGQELISGLSELQGLEFVHMKSGSPEPAYFFKHALTQEVAYNSLLIAKRKEIHQRIGDAIEELYPNRLEEFYEVLAAHYSKGQSLEKAARYIRLSAEKALKSNSLWVALRLYKELLALLDQEHEADERKKEKIEVLVSMIPILRGLGFPEDPADILQEGARLCKGVQDKRSMAVIHAYAAMAFTYRGDAALGVDYLEQTYLRAVTSQEFDIIKEVVVGLIPNYVLRGEFRKVVDVASNVFHLFEKAHPTSKDFGMPVDLHVTLLLNRGSAMGFLGDFEHGEEECRKAVSISSNIGRAFSIGDAELSYGTLLTQWGRTGQATAHLQKSIENYEKSQGTIWLPTAWSYLGLAHSFEGDGSRALECLENALRMQVESGLPSLLSLHHCNMSSVHLELGDSDKALFHAGEAIRLAEANDGKHHEALSLIYLGLAEWRIRRIPNQEAEERLGKAIEKLKGLGLKPWEAQGNLHLGALLAESGEPEKARQRIGTAESMFLEMGMDHWTARARSALKRI
ncbi:MAG: guanylate cyclase [Deltaproteobacteria bacterium HGW-Deltaproteobacteria-15]|nr:MAG: guanylate cyclase [Deltaproteobacteria bacterium HGW-Deltaproteobacteria-15]